ncbi:MBL fold metallo-hydrolase [Salinimicrobium xinjiangense]|uniref:MBL fold metallo-hydrolase n=1 Tax=Salinimicrobium xinjiangense TaxID=438596 RepID=UPI000425AE75|nr:MBL fold metallo-hydrolase [Salinimicrobium xinjiangense]
MPSQLQFIRNATLVYNYGGKRILMDPMFAQKDTYPGFPGTVNSDVRNPLVELPVKPESLFDVDAVLLTHLHTDHWDRMAQQILPKDLKILVQNTGDAQKVESQGFTDVEVLPEQTNFDGLQITKTRCQHGNDAAYTVPEMAEFLGESSGFYFSAEGDRSVYFLGDTIWIDEIEQNIKNLKPDVVVVNAGRARMEDGRFGAILTGKEDVERIHKLLPTATIITIHMEALNHCSLSRSELRKFAKENAFSEKLIIPKEGDAIDLGG